MDSIDKVEELVATNDDKDGNQLASVSRTVSTLDDASDHLAQITQEMEDEVQEHNSQNLLEALKLLPRKRPHPIEEGVNDSTREMGEDNDIVPGTKKSNSGTGCVRV